MVALWPLHTDPLYFALDIDQAPGLNYIFFIGGRLPPRMNDVQF